MSENSSASEKDSTKEEQSEFVFNISLSVLNHLGRNLYRSFATVLGEAISNSWDADAENVQIYLDRPKKIFVIADDGVGMTSEEFQSKFLRIGYSKRQDSTKSALHKRPYIGQKGIGKLALLSCAERITVITKKSGHEIVSGTVDNRGLDQAISDDLLPEDYMLEQADQALLDSYDQALKHGTIIYFDGVKGGIRNTADYLKKIIALYFRFSLIDPSFKISVQDELVDHSNLSGIGEKTQFLWTINEHTEPFIEEYLPNLRNRENLDSQLPIRGFVATTDKPSDLKIRETEEKLTLDLFVNGRLREKDLLSHIASNRLPETYMYGQLHYDELDDGSDPFTSAREGLKEDDPRYNDFLAKLKPLIGRVITAWDPLRNEINKDGDSENSRVTPKERKSQELFNVVSEEYEPEPGDENAETVNEWNSQLKDDAAFCFSSYAECYISENIIRKFIEANGVSIPSSIMKDLKDKYRPNHASAKAKANFSLEIRQDNSDLSYLAMDELAAVVDSKAGKDKIKNNSLVRDAIDYKPHRDALMHTALLTDNSKTQLGLVYENIKGRIRQLLADSTEEEQK